MRTILSLNDAWTFTGPTGGKAPVQIPHTWNAVDGQDGGNDYKRCECLYERTFKKPSFEAGQRVYLQFHGVNSECRVELNGKQMMSHEGGYSTFRRDVTDDLLEDNTLKVYVTNAVNDRVYPQKADFTFYGGIYRDVELLIVNGHHFDLDDFGGPGIHIPAKPV
ncbi:MAG: glycoside hydrolase family 2 protein, partial [Clostridia bacterium]|nr:glycoside hydrolase family 2 protein [Clostridia bacterium]